MKYKIGDIVIISQGDDIYGEIKEIDLEKKIYKIKFIINRRLSIMSFSHIDNHYRLASKVERLLYGEI